MQTKLILLIALVIVVIAVAVYFQRYYFVLGSAPEATTELNQMFNEEIANATRETGLNFTLIMHEDQSVSLYSFLPNTTIGSDGLPDVPAPGYCGTMP